MNEPTHVAYSVLSTARVQAYQEEAVAFVRAQKEPPPFPRLVRALEMRTAVGWRIVAPLLESGVLRVRDGGFVAPE